MARQRSPRRTTEDFAAALSGAHSERARGLAGRERRHPDPACLDNPAEYVDYAVPPARDEAQEMCLDCPLMQACLANAKRTLPAWGVLGGVAWVRGRQAHLLSPERLAEIMEEELQ